MCDQCHNAHYAMMHIYQVRALLEAEAGQQMHSTPGRLAEPSGALGLLWIRRCLCFQQAILHGVRSEQGSVKTVSNAAYASFYAPFHGWLARKTFQLGLAAVPSRDVLFLRIAPCVDESEQEQLCLREVGECADVMRLVVDAMRRSFEALQLDDRRKV